MSNRVQLRRTSTPGNVPTLLNTLVGELVINLADDNVYYNDGSQIVQLNAAANIRTDANHQFVTQSQVDAWNQSFTLQIASASTLGGVKIGQNITIDADGTIHIPDASASTSGILTSTDWATFNGKQNALGYVPVNKAGDTMTGPLILSGDPVNVNDAVNKHYTDTGLATKLNLSGGTMTGPLILSGDPVDSLGATTKQYVDGLVNQVSGEFAAPVQTLADLAAVPYAGLPDKQLRLVEDAGAIFRYDTASTDTADGVNVILSTGNTGPGRWIKVQAATQYHNTLYGIQGGAANDYLHLTTAEKNGYDAHLANTTIHLTATESAWLATINASAAEVNYLVGVTSSVQTQLDGKQAALGYVPVNKAGDTMTGMLTLSGDPTADGHAATKHYVDNFTVDGGTF